MAQSLGSSSEKEPSLKLDTNLDPKEPGHGSTAAPEPEVSSEDELAETQEMPAEDARTAISVSIGRKQTWLTSPQTPAIEKAAAIEEAGGFWSNFDGTKDTIAEEVEEGDEMEEEVEEPLEGVQDEEEDTASEADEQEELRETGMPARSPMQAEEKLPSPWRVDANQPWDTGERPRSGLFDGIFNRLRSSSNPDAAAEGSRKSLRSSLTSKSKHFSLSSQSSSPHGVGTSSDTSTAPAGQMRPRSGSDSGVPEFSQIEAISGPEANIEESRRSSVQSGLSKTGILRRSTSDHSLAANRVFTRTETLGDDSRFTDVHNQVNSRLQAIKDSWQDANIRISGLPNIKVANFTPDFLRERTSLYNRRSTVRGLSVDTNTVMPAHPSKPIDPMTRQPYSTAREAMHDAPTPKHLTHPHFTRALEKLEGDLVVLGGYRGSILRSAEPPHRQVWVPIKVGLNIRKVNLEVGFEEGDDEAATDHVIPDGMLTHIGPVDISRRLFKRFRQCENNRNGKLTVHDYGYDWRLSPLHLSKKLIQFLETLPCNQEGVAEEKRGATVIAHSLGGLITRHAVNQRPELFRGVVYAGVPQTCVNILGPLRNGDEVLLSQRVLTAQVNFSIRTSFALLPLDGRCFFDIETNEEYPVDFFDVNTWIDLRLSPCVNRPLPPLQPPPKPTGITAYVSSLSNALPNLPLRYRKDSTKVNGSSKVTTAGGAASANMTTAQKSESGLEMSMDDNDPTQSVRTACTISREKATEYLDRTLKSVKRFKQELAFNPKHADTNAYPPIALIYGKSTPTVYGAKVNGREGIKHADAYDNLAFASGDGVVLARAAQAPEGYKPARGGVVSSQRGHVTLLGDLEAVGKCLNAVIRARQKGVGKG